MSSATAALVVASNCWSIVRSRLSSSRISEFVRLNIVIIFASEARSPQVSTLVRNSWIDEQTNRLEVTALSTSRETFSGDLAFFCFLNLVALLYFVESPSRSDCPTWIHSKWNSVRDYGHAYNCTCFHPNEEILTFSLAKTCDTITKGPPLLGLLMNFPPLAWILSTISLTTKVFSSLFDESEYFGVSSAIRDL